MEESSDTPNPRAALQPCPSCANGRGAPIEVSTSAAGVVVTRACMNCGHRWQAPRPESQVTTPSQKRSAS